MLLRYMMVVCVCVAYQLKCPEPAQWSIRARSHCKDQSKYSCLRNDLLYGYSENCTISDFLQPGRKHVLRGGLDADICSSERYQPWPINFYTNVSTDCIFLKSLCNEEGQVVYGNGSRHTDATCGCDFTRGYNFLFKPRNLCFCVPTQEDCSCFINTCPKSTDKLSQDYECLHVDNNKTVFECKQTIYKRVNKNITQLISKREDHSTKVQEKTVITAFCILCFGVLICSSSVVLNDKYLVFSLDDLFINEPPSEIELIEGETLELIYKLSTSKFKKKVLFMKNNHFIAENTNLKKRIGGYSNKLKFTAVAPSDTGTYCLKVAGKKSSLTKLIVHPIFSSKTKPKICIEGTQILLTCSVYANDIEVQWYKERQNLHYFENIEITNEEKRHTLIIKKSTIMDSGTYYAKAGKGQIDIPVTVKALFRRQLEDVTIMEGLDVHFECETEEEYCHVQWFYDDKEIIYSTERMKIDKSNGRLHTLTVLQSSLEDSGKYSIRINDRDSIAELEVKEMPESIKEMSVHDIEEFLKAAKSGIKNRYNIRVMIVGENSVGKTCLLRRLMNEQIEDVISTDGINIERRKCQVDINTGKWHFFTTSEEIYSFWCKHSEQLADCGFWDFAGQKEFYATHQTFLSTNAVYLLVVDISKDLTEKTYDDMIEKEFDCIGEYIDFWLDNIHCYSRGDKNTSIQCNKNDGKLNPPVIIVGTGIDKIALHQREKREKNFEDHLSNVLSDHAKRRHLRQPHYLSNTLPSDNKEEFKRLRKDIVCKAKDLTDWGDNLPTRWIVLEKEIYRKIKEEVISYDKVVDLATMCSFPNVKQSTTELDSFLKMKRLNKKNIDVGESASSV